jgi:hypothetical protein
MRLTTYLRGIASGCLEAADNPTPAMIQTITAVLDLAGPTIAALSNP